MDMFPFEIDGEGLPKATEDRHQVHMCLTRLNVVWIDTYFFNADRPSQKHVIDGIVCQGRSSKPSRAENAIPTWPPSLARYESSQSGISPTLVIHSEPMGVAIIQEAHAPTSSSGKYEPSLTAIAVPLQRCIPGNSVVGSFEIFMKPLDSGMTNCDGVKGIRRCSNRSMMKLWI